MYSWLKYSWYPTQDGCVNFKYILLNGNGCYNWRKWFAWYPVKTVSGKKFWWEYIFKRKVRLCYERGYFFDVFQYATFLEIIHNTCQQFEKED